MRIKLMVKRGESGYSMLEVTPEELVFNMIGSGVTFDKPTDLYIEVITTQSGHSDTVHTLKDS